MKNFSQNIKENYNFSGEHIDIGVNFESPWAYYGGNWNRKNEDYSETFGTPFWCGSFECDDGY